MGIHRNKRVLASPVMVIAVALLPAVAAKAIGPPPVFTDVTAEAGINYIQWNIPNPRPQVEKNYMTGGAAAGDYDNDGRVDLFVTRYDASDILYRNVGGGRFENVTAGAGLTDNYASNGAAWGDIDRA